MGDFDLESPIGHIKEENIEEQSESIPLEHDTDDVLNATVEASGSTSSDTVIPIAPQTEEIPAKRESSIVSIPISEANDTYVGEIMTNKQPVQRRVPNAVLPLLRFQQYESSESSSRYIIIVLLFSFHKEWKKELKMV